MANSMAGMVSDVIRGLFSKRRPRRKSLIPHRGAERTPGPDHTTRTPRRILGSGHTTIKSPPWARSRRSPPTMAPRPAESRKSTAVRSSPKAVESRHSPRPLPPGGGPGPRPCPDRRARSTPHRPHSLVQKAPSVGDRSRRWRSNCTLSRSLHMVDPVRSGLAPTLDHRPDNAPSVIFEPVIPQTLLSGLCRCSTGSGHRTDHTVLHTMF
ncbi:MAG: hypothetical protein CM1200mP26_03120 [Acidimicrobiales bacterium]|nr:MAG: hypothetical protein CM1200mP26_03120 [Acidimicrobiales bacterium]